MIKINNHGDVLEVRVKGDIDHCEMVELRNVISGIIMEGHSKIVLSMKDVKHINYLSIGVLVERLRRVRSCGGDMKIAGMSSYIRNIFTVVGAEEFFDIYDTLEEVISSSSPWEGVDTVMTGSSR